jgi:hypothetical protein
VLSLSHTKGWIGDSCEVLAPTWYPASSGGGTRTPRPQELDSSNTNSSATAWKVVLGLAVTLLVVVIGLLVLRRMYRRWKSTVRHQRLALMTEDLTENDDEEESHKKRRSTAIELE